MTTTIDAQRWSRLSELFDAASDLPDDARDAFIESVHSEDADLAQELRRLLAADAGAGAFLESPVSSSNMLDYAPGSRQFGAYRLLRLVGRGGMGEVHLAERADGVFEQHVALKLLPHPTPGLLQRFAQERRILARLEHPNIARLLDGGVGEHGIPYFAMEFIDGEPITQHVRERHLDVAATLRLFVSVCDAVQYAHRNLVVHRDLKPSNILVNADGAPKLLDFGIAKMLETTGAGNATRTAARVFTPDYAAPEQIRGEPVTTATDVYALGVVLYELLAGRRPYTLEQAILTTEPASPSRATNNAARRRTLRGDVDRIVLKALAKEPERRYPSAEALAADLRACLDGRPIAARGDSAMYRLRKFIRRNKVGVAAAVVVALALIAATGVSVWQAGIARAQAQRAETKSATAEAEKDFLLSVFSSANPYKTDGKTVTARDLLEGGLEQTATKLAGQPQVQAEIYTSFVETFVQLDQIPLAERSANLARDAYAKFLPDDAVEVLRAEQLQDQVQLWATHMDGLAPRIENLLARIGERGGEYAELRGAVLQMLTSTYYRSGQLDQAARIGDQTIAQQRSLHAQYHYDVGLALYQLALIRLAQGRPADTAVLIGELAPGDRTLVGPEHPGLMTDVTIIGRYFNAVGRLPEAQELLAAALAARRRQFPETHNFVLRTRALLAAAQLDAGNADAVEATLAAIIATAEALPDAAVDDLAEMHCDRGRALVALGRYDEAQRELDAAHALILRQTDATARVPLAIEAAVADLTRRHGDAAAARADLGRIAQQQRQRDDRELPATLLALARALKASGATVQATGAPLREAAEVLRRKGSSTQGLAREIEIELAQLTSGEEAFTHWQHAAEIGCLNFGCDDARTQQLVQHAAAAKGVPKAEVVARLAQSDGVRNPPGQTLYITARDILDKAAAARAADAAKNGSAPP